MQISTRLFASCYRHGNLSLLCASKSFYSCINDDDNGREADAARNNNVLGVTDVARAKDFNTIVELPTLFLSLSLIPLIRIPLMLSVRQWREGGTMSPTSRDERAKNKRCTRHETIYRFADFAETRRKTIALTAWFIVAAVSRFRSETSFGSDNKRRRDDRGREYITRIIHHRLDESGSNFRF